MFLFDAISDKTINRTEKLRSSVLLNVRVQIAYTDEEAEEWGKADRLFA